MNRETFRFELITPCFCSGADSRQSAELRVPSIRGQLRWWFRTLSGFQELAQQGMRMRQQEAHVFGTTAGAEGCGSRLALKILHGACSVRRVNAEDMNAPINDPLGYALFPLRPTHQDEMRRGMIHEATEFTMVVQWRGRPEEWPLIRALVGLWGHLGALGFRSRRGFGAVQLRNPEMDFRGCLDVFANPAGINVCELDGPFNDWRSTAKACLQWYRDWRHHGQMNRRWDKNNRQWVPIPQGQRQANRGKPGFRWARRDHNEGLAALGFPPGTVPGGRGQDPENPAGQNGETFRPALGLPIIQYFSSLGGPNVPLPRSRATVNWGTEAGGIGRFASPVLLRPYKDADGRWHALVIFVDAHRWPEGRPVYLNGEPRQVRLDLYEAMKNDKRLRPFVPA